MPPADRRIVGAEAQARWEDAQLGAVPPAEFIPLAERLGLVGEITDWVLRAAGRDRRLPRPGDQRRRQFLGIDFYDLTSSLACKTPWFSQRTARPAGHRTDRIGRRAGRAPVNERCALRAWCRVCTFGTGYTVLAYLRHAAVDALKIDTPWCATARANPPPASRRPSALARWLSGNDCRGAETEAGFTADHAGRRCRQARST